jgi:pseudouridine-5'-phosphate glycosidase
MNRPMQVSEEIRQALDRQKAVVAMESTVIAHGLPFPTNLEAARRMEALVRQHGAIPATIAVLDGQLRIGLSADELEHLATAKGIRKVSRRDLPIVVATGGDGATTVAATVTIAAWAGIPILATGGIGGVHRTPPYDISNDLPTLASVPVAVVCSGAKSVLNLPATLEWLETLGIPVIGYGTSEFPAFYSRQSGLLVDSTVETPQEAAAIIYAGRQMGLPGGTLIAVPVPADVELPAKRLEAAISASLAEAEARDIEGSATTPFLLRWIARQTDGASIKANVALLENNASIAAQIAVALQEMS